MDLFSQGWPEVRFRKNKRQKYIRIRVRPELITVSAPYRCNQKEMLLFLGEKRDWIDKTLVKMRARLNRLDQIESDHEGKILIRGQWKPVVIRQGNHSRRRICENDDTLFYEYPKDEKAALDKGFIQNYYRRCAESELRNRLTEISMDLPFKYDRVFIRSQKTKWGTCSSKGNLSFNWRLIKCPVWIWDYLFIHELCHTVHMNHSKSYWELVGQYFPRYKEARTWIRAYGPLVFRDP